jgi:NADH:ubiquinone oxidoreductase subunit 6 (subunit J)
VLGFGGAVAMWWKLTGLLLITAVLVVAVIPLRTHAVGYDPITESPPHQPSLISMFGNMYLTPFSAVAILLILALAGFVAAKILRGQW